MSLSTLPLSYCTNVHSGRTLTGVLEGLDTYTVNVAKALGVKRFSAGSFSESVRLFDPERLKPILAELAGGLAPQAKDPRLAQLKHALTLVDGTVLTALTRLAKSACLEDRSVPISPSRIADECPFRSSGHRRPLSSLHRRAVRDAQKSSDASHPPS